MDPRLWNKVAALSGMTALGLGTYGAHGFKPKTKSLISSLIFVANKLKVWHTASLYHLVHTAALVAAPITNRLNIFGGLLTAGILAFSGTLDVLYYVLPLICNPSL
ncbi:hypothetical protein F0562_011278 [Nyssa sinensis]|uniref:Uncharacterized protein n=1 Tax=Nyssa sinensis TaxID=561372 RepID=A0A5J5A177_9ASTE|nr:hypothetical protein F0562_011278 [Nyssa sinensis]